MRRLLLLLWWLYAATAWAQNLEAMLDRVRDLALEGQMRPARVLLDRVIAQLPAEGQDKTRARAFLFKAQAHLNNNEAAPAMEAARKSLELSQKLKNDYWVAESYRIIASVFLMRHAAERFKAALDRSIEAAGQIQNLEDKGRVYLNLVRTAQTTEQRDMLTEAAVRIARELKNPRMEGNLLRLQGERRLHKDDFAGGLGNLEAAALLYEKAGDRKQLAAVLTNIGRIHRVHNQFANALAYYRRAFEIQRELNDPNAINSLSAIAAAESDSGKIPEALETFRRALSMARLTKRPVLIRRQEIFLGFTYLAAKDYEHAIPLLDENLTEVKPALRSEGQRRLAEAELLKGDRDAALKRANTAVQAGRVISSSIWLFLALETRASVFMKREQFSNALEDVKEAIRLLDVIRPKLAPLDFMRRGFSEQNQKMFHMAVDLHFRNGTFPAALEAAEQARSRTLLDILATRNHPEAVNALPSEGASSLLDDILQDDDPADDDPPIVAAVSQPAATIATMAATAKRLNTTFVAYWSGKDSLFIWTLTSDGMVKAARVNVSSERLAALASQAAARSLEKKDVWNELYRYLIQPVAANLPANSRLTVIPHGPLFRISFAALRDGAGKYLIEKHPIHYASAGGLLDLTVLKRNKEASPVRQLLVADPAQMPPGPDGKALAPLAGSRQEAESVASLLPKGAATVLSGARATKEALLADVQDKTILHFATHGVIREDVPFESFLALAKGDKLTAREIYDLKLTSQLVVLSACRSGLGKLSGEGILGLTRAFFYAGVPSVVASLWDVADEPAARLLTEFYRSYNGRGDTMIALRDAQLRVLQLLRAGKLQMQTPAGPVALPEHPILWAGFTLQGEP